MNNAMPQFGLLVIKN